MTSTAARSQGSTIAYLDTTVSPNAYVTIPNIVQFQTPSPESPDIDVSDLSSTAREYLVGLKDNGEISMTGFYKSAEAAHAALRAAAGGTTVYTFRITLKDTSPHQTVTFTALVKAFRVGIEVDAAQSLEIVLRTTGDATWS